MGYPGDFVSPVTDCMNPTFPWPDIAGPGGLPNFTLATFLSNMAGINFILDFLPPDPGNPPSLPSISIFSDAFLGGMNIAGDIGEIQLPGLTIPATGPDIRFPQEGMIKLIIVCITLPFQIIIAMVEKLLELEIALPTIPGVTALFNDLALSAGLSGASVAAFGGCLATAIVALFTDLIPV